MSNIHRGKAAFYLFEVDSLAPKVVSDLTRQAVALREQAVKAKTEEAATSLVLQWQRVGLRITTLRARHSCHSVLIKHPIADALHFKLPILPLIRIPRRGSQYSPSEEKFSGYHRPARG